MQSRRKLICSPSEQDKKKTPAPGRVDEEREWENTTIATNKQNRCSDVRLAIFRIYSNRFHNGLFYSNAFKKTPKASDDAMNSIGGRMIGIYFDSFLLTFYSQEQHFS